MIEKLGLPGTVQAAGTLNLALAAAVWLLARGTEESMGTRPGSGRDSAGAAPFPPFLAVALLTGTASFVFEIGWIRMLSLVLGSSTHSFELMLSAFILGLACGGYWVRRRIDSIADPARFLGVVLVTMGLLALATLPLYGEMFGLMQAVMNALAKTETGYTLFLLSSHGIALAIMFPATFCAGITLPLITYALLPRRKDDDRQPHGFRHRPEPAHQRQVGRRDQHEPERSARVGRNHDDPHGGDSPGLQTRCGERRGHRNRNGPHDAHAPRLERAALGRDDRDRACDGRGVATLFSTQYQRLRGSTQPHHLRRREDVLLDAQPQVRHHHLGAVQPLGQRRLEPVHRRVLSAGAPLPQSRWNPGPVVSDVRDGRESRRLGAARARRKLSGLRHLRRHGRRPADHRRRDPDARAPARRHYRDARRRPGAAPRAREFDMGRRGPPGRGKTLARPDVPDLRGSGQFGLLSVPRPARGEVPLPAKVGRRADRPARVQRTGRRSPRRAE